MNCKTCINNREKCRTMLAPVKNYACHMTKQEAIQAERDIMAYNKDRGVTEEAKLNINRLESREG